MIHKLHFIRFNWNWNSLKKIWRKPKTEFNLNFCFWLFKRCCTCHSVKIIVATVALEKRFAAYATRPRGGAQGWGSGLSATSYCVHWGILIFCAHSFAFVFYSFYALYYYFAFCILSPSEHVPLVWGRGSPQCIAPTINDNMNNPVN